MQECTPFAVIGSNTVVEARGQRVRGRLYPWGIVEGDVIIDFFFFAASEKSKTTHVEIAFNALQWKTNPTATL